MGKPTPGALAKIDELEQLARGGGYPDPEVLRRVRAIVFSLRGRVTG